VAAGPAAGAGTPQRKTVKVLDNYYSPAKLTVNNRSTITWKWPEDAGDIHDVKLKSGPRGAKKFASDGAATSFSYRQRLVKPGTYRLVCTYHEEMTMTIKVRR
jgi:plastocyanin